MCQSIDIFVPMRFIPWRDLLPFTPYTLKLSSMCQRVQKTHTQHRIDASPCERESGGKRRRRHSPGSLRTRVRSLIRVLMRAAAAAGTSGCQGTRTATQREFFKSTHTRIANMRNNLPPRTKKGQTASKCISRAQALCRAGIEKHVHANLSGSPR